MKKTLFILLIFVISSGLFAQKIDYSISAGSNLSYLTLNGLTNYIRSTPKLGINIGNKITLPINKFLTYNIGFDISLIQTEYQYLSFTTTWGRYAGITYEALYGQESDTISNGIIDNGDGTYSVNDVVVYAEEFNKAAYSNDVVNSSAFRNEQFLKLNLPIKIGLNLFDSKLRLHSGVSISALLFANQYDPFLMSMEFDAEYKVFKNIYSGISFSRSLTNFNLYKLNSFAFNLSYKF